MIYLLGWLLAAWATREVAKGKGRTGADLTTWTVLGLLFGVFALFAIAVSRPNTKGLEEERLAAGDLRRCPFCAELIRPEAVKCRYCGEAVTAIARPAASTRPYRIIEAPPGTLSIRARWTIALTVLAIFVAIALVFAR